MKIFTFICFTIMVVSSLGELTHPLLSDGFPHEGVEGRPPISCISRKIGSDEYSIKECRVDDINIEMGCYSLWSDAGLVQQGCMSIAEGDRRCKEECISPAAFQEMHYCCCTKDGCNALFSKAEDEK
ncbi:hypothetical protein PMAYCL1PPCAC_28637 [Pristionchus mayeri]|uniref:Activin types I and II receptor domain-containing protein n=1 Tax=Pristionchus mayeri TaxID=1317129 RepID=A0AAN5D9D3_9BILA|nr:hypothetical protein PMAYCL1PPCAC_28637 [Pristionchus mayeri]